MSKFAAARKKAGRFRRGRKAEESPDRTEHPAAEIAGGSNLSTAVTENDRWEQQG